MKCRKGLHPWPESRLTGAYGYGRCKRCQYAAHVRWVRRKRAKRLTPILAEILKNNILHLHSVRLSDSTIWRVVTERSPLCDDESRCFSVRIRLKVA